MPAAFRVRVNGDRIFTITIAALSPCTVDCRDNRTGCESQAIDVYPCNPESVLADGQVRDAIRSAYYNATSRDGGRYPGAGLLPEDFRVTRIS